MFMYWTIGLVLGMFGLGSLVQMIIFYYFIFELVILYTTIHFHCPSFIKLFLQRKHSQKKYFVHTFVHFHCPSFIKLFLRRKHSQKKYFVHTFVQSQCAFGMDEICQLILLFNLFLLLFMCFTTLFGIIYKSHFTISVNFYLYLQYFL